MKRESCRTCGRTAAIARVNDDGSLTWFCADHAPEDEIEQLKDAGFKPPKPRTLN